MSFRLVGDGALLYDVYRFNPETRILERYLLRSSFKGRKFPLKQFNTLLENGVKVKFRLHTMGSDYDEYIKGNPFYLDDDEYAEWIDSAENIITEQEKENMSTEEFECWRRKYHPAIII